MLKKVICLFVLVCPLFAVTPRNIESPKNEEGQHADEVSELYEDLSSDTDGTMFICRQAFIEAMKGLERIKTKNKEILTIIDFTKPSTQKRLCVIDLKNKKILYSTVVAHGRNSGANYATSFSNVSGSYQSSLGFYVTENVYMGKNGYSLVLDGLEKGINDKAKERAIVIHGAKYANPSTIAAGGRLGRSLGCPALPESLATPIINTIKNGSVIYIYAGNKEYTNKSILVG